MSDTCHNQCAGCLKDQEMFQADDMVSVETNCGRGMRLVVVPFTNMCDKGHRAKLVAWRADKKWVLQPVWADSDRRFAMDDTLLTASVASD